MLSPADRASIEVLLRRTADAARERRNEARLELQRTVSELPYGVPAADGGVRIHAATAAERYASRAYHVAMRRLYDFLLDGKTPEEFDTESSDSQT